MDTHEPTDEVLAQRKQAARAARLLMEAARRGEGADDIRMMMLGVCSRLGHVSIIDLADDEPAAVIELWEAVELMQEQSFDAVEAKYRDRADK